MDDTDWDKNNKTQDFDVGWLTINNPINVNKSTLYVPLASLVLFAISLSFAAIIINISIIHVTKTLEWKPASRLLQVTKYEAFVDLYNMISLVVILVLLMCSKTRLRQNYSCRDVEIASLGCFLVTLVWISGAVVCVRYIAWYLWYNMEKKQSHNQVEQSRQVRTKTRTLLKPYVAFFLLGPLCLTIFFILQTHSEIVPTWTLEVCIPQSTVVPVMPYWLLKLCLVLAHVGTVLLIYFKTLKKLESRTLTPTAYTHSMLNQQIHAIRFVTLTSWLPWTLIIYFERVFDNLEAIVTLAAFGLSLAAGSLCKRILLRRSVDHLPVGAHDCKCNLYSSASPCDDVDIKKKIIDNITV